MNYAEWKKAREQGVVPPAKDFKKDSTYDSGEPMKSDDMTVVKYNPQKIESEVTPEMEKRMVHRDDFWAYHFDEAQERRANAVRRANAKSKRIAQMDAIEAEADKQAAARRVPHVKSEKPRISKKARANTKKPSKPSKVGVAEVTRFMPSTANKKRKSAL